jgi:predicted nucleic acid-binding protein/predicted transcriptional regulator
MKVKVGTQLEDEVYRELKIVAARDKRPISDINQHALTDYLQRRKGSRQRKSGLARLLERPPLKVTDEQFREVMELTTSTNEPRRHPHGSRVFVDSNVILYALDPKSLPAGIFLSRWDGKAVDGTISTVTLAEVAHRRMVEEARTQGLTGSNPARALARRPELVRQLRVYAEDVRDLLAGELNVEPIRQEDFFVALELQNQHGLLTNDSLNLAVAKRLGIHEIATADANFDKVQGVIATSPLTSIHPSSNPSTQLAP